MAKKKEVKKELKTKNKKSVLKKTKPVKINRKFAKVIALLRKPSLRRIVFALVVISSLVWLFWGVPLPTNLSTEEYPVSTKIFDRNGKLIYEIYADKRRTPVKLEELPSQVKQSTIAIEDKDFYKHYGFSPTGIIRASYNIVFKQRLEGGSTLTQQLVKNALLSPERTIRRKIREFALTLIVETIYSKDQILEMYLNQIPYGSTAYGVEAASELYFDKPAKDLNLAEASLLAGLPQAPTRYSPFGSHPEAAKDRQRQVLNRMVEDEYISQEEADKAFEEKLTYAANTPPQAPHFALWIKEQLAEKYGERMVEQGGLRVKTTLDLDLQEFAQDAVATEVAKLKKQKVGNGAALVTLPATGEILAMVGSKDYFATDEDGKVNVTLAKRQPGSSIKPLNYALAIKDKKITPATVLADVPTCFKVSGQAAYCPVNYDFTFHGGVQTRFALGNSYNIPAVRVLALNGLQNFIDFSREMGLTTFEDPSRYGLSLTLGGGEVRPVDMAVAFGVFANQGVKQPLVSILKVEDWKGKIWEDNRVQSLEGDRVLPSEVSYLVSHMLLDNNARVAAFGDRSFLIVSGHPEVSVKTGTTNDRRDNWTIGYTSDAVVVVWVGNNDNSPMGGAVSGVSGASPIWNKVIRETLNRAEKGDFGGEKRGHAWPKQPEGVVGTNICASTGMLPKEENGTLGCSTRYEYFLADTIDTKVRLERQDIFIDKTNQTIANEKTPQENIETKNQLVLYDPLGTPIYLDIAVASQSASINYPLTKVD